MLMTEPEIKNRLNKIEKVLLELSDRLQKLEGAIERSALRPRRIESSSSVRRAWVIVLQSLRDLVEKKGRSVSIAELSESMKMDRRTVNNYLKTLEELKYVSKEINIDPTINARFLHNVSWDKIPEEVRQFLKKR